MDNTIITLTETEARLKYLYFIDIDAILEKITTSPQFEDLKSNPTDIILIENMLHTIYDIIFSSCELYTKFLSPSEYGTSCFGHPNISNSESQNKSDKLWEHTLSSTDISAYRSLLSLALRNHCIMYGFFNLVDNTARNSSDYYSEISLARDSANKSGYFNTYTEPVNEYRPTSQSLYQFKKQRSSYNMKMYSMQLFQKIPDFNKDNMQSIPRPYAAAYDFLFYNSRVYYIDSALQRMDADKKSASIKNTLWRDYIKLELDYIERKSGIIPSLRKKNNDYYYNEPAKPFILTGANLLLYDGPMEYWYGFSSIRFILNLLKQIDEIEATDYKSFTLHDFEGSHIISMCSSMLKCPLVYSRHFFLQYAIESVLNSSDMESSYLKEKSNVLMTRFPLNNSIKKEYNISLSLKLVSQFWDILNNITIPILEDVWSTCISKLPERMNNNSFDMIAAYKSYIDNNIDILTADFSILSPEQIRGLLTPPKLSNINNKNNFIYSSFNIENLKEHLKTAEKSPALDNMDAKPSIRRTVAEIIYDYLSTDSPRFKPNEPIPGFINHIVDPQTQYNLKLNDYFEEMLKKRIDLYSLKNE